MEIKEVKTRSDLKKFINLPWKIYRDDPHWVPPLKMAVKDILSSKHPFHETAEQANFLAERCGQVVGRISAIWPRDFNRAQDRSLGLFGHFESVNDTAVAQKLFDRACSWLKDKGATSVQGPNNPTSNYECGLLVEGFDDPPQVMMTYNPAYYVSLFEHMNLTKAKDLLAYNMSVDATFPPEIEKVAKFALAKGNVKCRFLNKKKLDEEIEKMYQVYESAWENNWGFIPPTRREFFHTAHALKPLIEEDMILFVEVGADTAGFMIILPDINQALKHIPNGRLLPFGIFKLLGYKKYCTRVRIPMLGIKPQYQKLGLAGLLYYQSKKSWEHKKQYQSFESSWILEDNRPMNLALRTIGAKPYKTYRIFEKAL